MLIYFVSLGCDKNLVDSEEMLGMLRSRGYDLTDDQEEADIIIVNTCCFIHDAKEESIETIIEMGQLRQTGNAKALIVTGCLAQRYKDEILRELPEIDGLLGTASYDRVLDAVDSILAGKPYSSFESIDRIVKVEGERIVTTGGFYEYLKIAEGCEKNCTYCIIPKIRGKFRSIPMESLVISAEKLARQGVKELILVAQETTLYGSDLYGEKQLHLLLKKLCKIEGIRWIRLLYCYPEEIYPELLQTMAEEEKICHYLDMPIQHASDSVLRRMGRRTSRLALEAKIAEIRSLMPDAVLRTTLISGFPGETEEDHQILLDFVDRMEFDRLGVFTYSPEEDTPAALMDQQIKEDVKEARRQEIMELQQEISLEKGDGRIGQELLVFIEGKLADEAAYVGRSYGDAPGVDGYIFVNTEETLISGDFVKVRVTGALEYDLIGELADEFTE